MEDFGTRGQRLWENLLARDPSLADESNPAREVAISACCTADRTDDLETLCQFAEPTVDGPSGPRVNPLYVEVRNQATLLARLIAALRMPDAISGKRPEARQIRGVQQPITTSGTVSALDRARARNAG